MTAVMDDFWKKVYDTMMTPLPPPPDLSPEIDRLFKYLRSVDTPKIGELPMPPEWMQRYVRERGLDRIPQAPQAPPASGLAQALEGTSSEAIRQGARQMLAPEQPVRYRPTGY